MGTIFNFGQTGSGKTFTMNGLMDRLAEDIFNTGNTCMSQSDASALGPGPGLNSGPMSSLNQVNVVFSYLEILGQQCSDCLAVATKETETVTEEGEEGE